MWPPRPGDESFVEPDLREQESGSTPVNVVPNDALEPVLKATNWHAGVGGPPPGKRSIPRLVRARKLYQKEMFAKPSFRQLFDED